MELKETDLAVRLAAVAWGIDRATVLKGWLPEEYGDEDSWEAFQIVAAEAERYAEERVAADRAERREPKGYPTPGAALMRRGDAVSDIREGSVADIPDEQLLCRAVAAARDRNRRKGEHHPRWSAVAEVFLLGSTYAAQLCKRFGLNPNEMVKR